MVLPREAHLGRQWPNVQRSGLQPFRLWRPALNPTSLPIEPALLQPQRQTPEVVEPYGLRLIQPSRDQADRAAKDAAGLGLKAERGVLDPDGDEVSPHGLPTSESRWGDCP